ncbi:MAG: NifU family protein [Candidatus Hodarchaeales archaeon]|jgi:Fe-S cluster biogenesis protein NfuA
MSTETEIIAALDTVRPYLQRDGGDVEFVKFDEEGIVHVRLQGACAGCPYSQMTLSNGIEKVLKEKVPTVKGVRPVMK